MLVGGLDAVDTREPIEFVVEPILPRRHVTLLAGDGGSGKSNLARVLGLHVAAGGNRWIGLSVQPGRVLFVTLEDRPDLLRHRAQNIVARYGLDAGRAAANFAMVNGGDTDAVLCAGTAAFGTRDAVMTSAFRELQAHAKGFDVVIIDNASDAYAANENARAQVRKFIRARAGIAREGSRGQDHAGRLHRRAAGVTGGRRQARMVPRGGRHAANRPADARRSYGFHCLLRYGPNSSRRRPRACVGMPRDSPSCDCWRQCLTVDQLVAGSSPAGGANFPSVVLRDLDP